MGKTNIQYADEVSNPLFARPVGDETVKIGTFCEKPDASGTCRNCWAEVLNLRFGNKIAFDKANRDKIEWRRREKEMNRLLMRNRQQARSQKFPGLPLVVFCCDTFDIFQPSISDELRDWVFDNYDVCTNLILLVQTTYPVRMKHYFKARYGTEGLPPHYWIGMSAGTQWWFDNHIGALKQIKAAQKYVIFEPLLEEITLDVPQMLFDANVNKQPTFTFAIIGGESGAAARPCHYSWVQFLVHQCRAAGVAPFVKQFGSNSIIWAHVYRRLENKPMLAKSHVIGVDKIYRIHWSDSKGGSINEFPLDLQIREFPAAEVTANV